MTSDALYRNFKKQILIALKQETAAIRQYVKMIEMVPNEHTKQILREIRDDEKDHFKKLSILRSRFPN